MSLKFQYHRPAVLGGGVDDVLVIPFGNHILLVYKFRVPVELRDLAGPEESLEDIGPELLRQRVQRPDPFQSVAPLFYKCPTVSQLFPESVQLHEYTKNSVIRDIVGNFGMKKSVRLVFCLKLYFILYLILNVTNIANFAQNGGKDMEAYKRELSKQEKTRLDKIKESKKGRISRLGEFILSGMTYGEINDKRAVLK